MSAELVKLVLDDADEKMAKAVEHARKEFSGVRTGRAAPALVEKLPVEYYGSEVPAAADRWLPGARGPDARHQPLRQELARRHREGAPALRPRPQPEQRRRRDPAHLPAAHRRAAQGAGEGREAHGRGGSGGDPQRAAQRPGTTSRPWPRTATCPKTTSRERRRSSTSSPMPTKRRSTRPSSTRKPSCSRSDRAVPARRVTRAQTSDGGPMTDERRQDDERKDPPSEGVRIIGAEEAAEALERGDVAQRRGDDEPRYGDRPTSPATDGPRPVLRFPLGSSSDPRDIERSPVAPADPISEPVDLPHWTEPPTGQVPQILPEASGRRSATTTSTTGRASPRPRRAGATRARRATTTRASTTCSRWGEDEDEPLGALDSRERPTHDDYFTFADLDEPGTSSGSRSVFEDEPEERFGEAWADDAYDEPAPRPGPACARTTSPHHRRPRGPPAATATWAWPSPSASRCSALALILFNIGPRRGDVPGHADRRGRRRRAVRRAPPGRLRAGHPGRHRRHRRAWCWAPTTTARRRSPRCCSSPRRCACSGTW